MIAHAAEEYPNECCGILAGKEEVVSHLYRITNTAHSPYRYLMDPQEQLDAMLDSEHGGRNVLAFYHSHTHSGAYPSETDVRMAVQLGWPGAYYILVSLEIKGNPQVKSFQIDDFGVISDQEFRIRNS
tara:strand:+ start:113 stop:496 length:384 start_codon:yes stop_codon:yes gene_type:complete